MYLHERYWWQTEDSNYNTNKRRMNSTKATETEGVGCLVQVTTQKVHHISEALTFVAGVWIALIDGFIQVTSSLITYTNSCKVKASKLI